MGRRKAAAANGGYVVAAMIEIVESDVLSDLRSAQARLAKHAGKLNVNTLEEVVEILALTLLYVRNLVDRQAALEKSVEKKKA